MTAAPFALIRVLGLGTTGSALAALCVLHGFRVEGVEHEASAAARGEAAVRRRIAEACAAAGRDPGAAGRLFRMRDAAGPASDADLVIEALPEDLGRKVAALCEQRELCGPSTVFATTTTGLSVAGIAADGGAMPRTVGLHLADPGAVSPAAAAAAVEVVCTVATDASVRLRVYALVRALGREPVPSADLAVPVGGHLLMALLNQAAVMYGDGFAGRDEIDAAMTLGCGLPVGPLRQLDRIGLDTAFATLGTLHERTGDPAFAPAPVLGSLVRAGLLGEKSGRGFHRYPDPDPDAADGPAAEAAARARPVRRVGVVGSGTMATGIVEVCTRAAFETVLAARGEDRAKQARAELDRSLESAVRRGRLGASDAEAARDRLTAVTGLDALADCDLVIEAVVEDLDVKREVFAGLGAVTRPGAVLATATSSLSVHECALAAGRPRDVVGLHFFNPAPAMRLVEVAGTFLTAAEALATAHTFCAALGKRAVGCPDRAGFIVNRLLLPYLDRAAGLLERRTVSVADVDLIMTGACGHPMGPFRLMDLIGLDVVLAALRGLREGPADPAPEPAAPLVRLVRAGYLGRKTGQGFYPYESDA